MFFNSKPVNVENNTTQNPFHFDFPEMEETIPENKAIEYLINYNDCFKSEEPIMFRNDVIQQTLSCLIGKFKPNALLVGAAGVGKTKIVEDIARRIANDDSLIPEQLKDYTIYELPLSNIVSGSGLVGDVERKTKNILEFAQDPESKVILFIDEVHVLINNNPTYEKIAQLMKPALARGNLKVIAATTLQESQNLMDDPAFNRRFTRIIVDELTKEQTREVLQQIKNSMFEHYFRKIAIPDKILDEVVSIAEDYKSMGSHRPDTAITLLDRALADAYINLKLLEMTAQNNLVDMNEDEPIISLSKEQLRSTAKRMMTGNSVKCGLDINKLKEEFAVIKGQDRVIESILDIIERDGLNLYPRTKPITLLFAGSSGVGKSETAKILAKELVDSKPIILNMTEYHSSASINRIIGAPAGYSGSDSKAELPFDILESNPYQIIILDEFEKADKSVQRLFMSAFEEGYIKTAKGKIVDFTKSIIIATTNAGFTNKAASIGFITDKGNNSGASITDLSSFFDVELLNRFTKILCFNNIDENRFSEIVADTYRRDVSFIKRKYECYSSLPDKIDNTALADIVKGNFVKEFGARPARKAVSKHIEDLILSLRRASSDIR